MMCWSSKSKGNK